MRALILCQGPGRRWGDYLGAPKQLAVQLQHPTQRCLETPPERLVRQLYARGATDVVVVAPDGRFTVPGAQLVTLDEPDPAGCDMSKLIATAPLWATDGHTVLLWGDAYLSDEVVDQVVAWQGGYHVWRRPGPSSTTGHQWDESFAVAWPSSDSARVLEVARAVAELHRAGQLRRGTHIRTHLAAYDGLPLSRWDNLRRVADLPSQTHVDDWSDDFDTPAEWAGWVGRHYAGAYPAAVVIPWHDSGCPERAAALDLVADHWRLVGLPVVYGFDETPGPWVNRSAARNDGARRARQLVGDDAVLLFGDADTLVNGAQAWAAIHLAATTGRAVLGFEQYVRLSGTHTRRAFRERASSRRWGPEHGRPYEHHISGALAVPARLHGHVGGYDERFRSWGGEDRSYHCVLDVLAGPVERIPGYAWHLFHPPTLERASGHPGRAEVLELAVRYKRAAGIGTGTGMWREAGYGADSEPDPDALRAILGEPGAPAAGRSVPPWLLERVWPPRPLSEPQTPPGSHGYGPPQVMAPRRREAPSTTGQTPLQHPDGTRVRMVRPDSATYVRLTAEGWRVVA